MFRAARCIKRAPWLRWMGGVPVWFDIHMTLGLVGPVLVLFHANFSLGATNSNVALICMLVVAGSGVIGRYMYTRLHAHMDGKEVTFEQLSPELTIPVFVPARRVPA